ncbi:unnamed protein product [Orchesella dallaii]|uniref:Uncharacterized protein n=1 Tax=Orchesella dallaii TaxID=48710 RepID=A0ABP1S0T4_9HEXA
MTKDNVMLLLDNLISYVQALLRVQATLGTIPFEFSTSNQLKLSSKRVLRRAYVKNILLFFYSAVIWAQFLYYQEDTPMVIKLQGFVFALSASAYSVTKWTVFKKREDFVELFNLFIQFEKHHQNRN